MRTKIIDAFILPERERDQGNGSEILMKLCGWADVEEVTLVVSADSTVCGRTGSKDEDDRLEEFYERFDFEKCDITGLYPGFPDKQVLRRDPTSVLSVNILTLRDF